MPVERIWHEVLVEPVSAAGTPAAANTERARSDSTST